MGDLLTHDQCLSQGTIPSYFFLVFLWNEILQEITLILTIDITNGNT